MAYEPNPYNVLQPTESVFAGTAAAEFRALKVALQAISTGSLYLGDWAAFTAGAGPHPAARGDQFTHLGKLWMLKVASADVELIPPSDLDTVNWFKLYEVSATGFVESTGTNGSARMPNGTTAQRDVAPAIGFTRWNTTLGCNETWNGTHWVPEGWQNFAPVSLTGLASHIFSAIPPWVNEININYTNVSAGGSGINTGLRLGTAGGILATGYNSASVYNNLVGASVGAGATTGVFPRGADVVQLSGVLKIQRHDTGNIWHIVGDHVDRQVGHVRTCAVIDLAAPLTQVELLCVANFDGGSASISWRK
jgi:hypothetical protein